MAAPKGMFRGTILFLNAMITIPIFSILFYKILYWSSIYYSAHNNVYLLTAIMAYTLYILLDKSPTNGGWTLSDKLQQWCNNAACFRYLAEYFDAQLIKEKDLDSTKQYIFVYHPHGIIGVGVCVALATNGTEFEKHFPGVQRKAVTLNATFLTPIFREWIIANGFISANKSTLTRALKTKSIVLVPGGAAEALHTQRDTMKLHLQNRKGFVRLAMETNKPLIPCLGFGENDIFDTLVTTQGDSGWRGVVWSLQYLFLRATSVSPPILTNPMPRPVRLRVVVGSPLPMDPQKTVDENHATYVDQLIRMYHTHAKVLGHEHVKLEIL